MKSTVLDPTDGAHHNMAIQILSPDDGNTPSYEDVIFNHSETIQMSKISMFSNCYGLFKMGQ
jgi:hypothetical protein